MPTESGLIRAREAGDELHAPDLLLVECANAFWKRVSRGELDRESAMAAIGALSDVGASRTCDRGAVGSSG